MIDNLLLLALTGKLSGAELLLTQPLNFLALTGKLSGAELLLTRPLIIFHFKAA